MNDERDRARQAGKTQNKTQLEKDQANARDKSAVQAYEDYLKANQDKLTKAIRSLLTEDPCGRK